MSNYEQLKSQQATLQKLMDNFYSLGLTDLTGADLSALMLLLIKVSDELGSYSHSCPNCGGLKSDEATYQAGVAPFNVYKCNHCGSTVTPL